MSNIKMEDGMTASIPSMKVGDLYVSLYLFTLYNRPPVPNNFWEGAHAHLGDIRTLQKCDGVVSLKCMNPFFMP